MRIVSLLPSATEILFAIGAGEELVGVTHECDFPAAARNLPVLTSSSLPASHDAAEIDRHVRTNVHKGSSLYNLDSELLERLAPDLIITQELCEVCAVSYEIVSSAVRRLRGDPRIISLEPNSLDDVFLSIETLGRLSSHEREAREIVSALKHDARALRERARQAIGVPVRLLFLEWSDPPFGAGHWSPDLLELIGVEALLTFQHARAQRLTWESIASCDPDIIAVAPCGVDATAAKNAVDALSENATWTTLRAVREGRTIVLDGNAYFNRPGVRLLEGASLLLDAIVALR